MEAILKEAGWTGIGFEPFDFAMIVGGGESPVGDAVDYFASIGPAARAAREMEPADRARFFEQVRELARLNIYDGFVSLRAGAWIVTARKA